MDQGAGGSGGIDLSPTERADIDGMYLRLASGNLYEVLGVRRDSERREIRDAYFALSQRFHPDAYFGRNLGAYKARTEEIFRDVTRAYEVLSHKGKRGEYDATLPPDTSPPRPPPPPAAAPAPPTPAATPAQPGQQVVARAPTSSGATSPVSIPAAPRTPSFSAPTGGPAVSAPISAPMGAPARPSISAPAQPARPSGPPPPAMSQEAARAAAREALARRLGGAAATSRSGSMPAVNPAAARPASTPETTAASLEQLRKEKLVRDHLDRVESLKRTASEAEAKGDWSAANNALQLLLGMMNSEEVRARADHAGRKLFEVQAVQLLIDAKLFEKNGQYDKALPHYLRIIAGRPDDHDVLTRAARCMLKLNKELPKAAEYARKAVQLEPRSVDAQVTLGYVFLVGGLKASALGAAEAAAKLDPTSQAVKDLQAKLKG